MTNILCCCLLKVKDLHDWLSHWDEQFSHGNGKRKRQSNSAEKKAVLLSGTPGIGKTTSAKLVSKMLGYEIIEVPPPSSIIIILNLLVLMFMSLSSLSFMLTGKCQ